MHYIYMYVYIHIIYSTCNGFKLCMPLNDTLCDLSIVTGVDSS